MQNDFRENYIREQKELAMARKNRLAKIGMGDSSRDTAKRPAQQPRPTAQAQRPVQQPRPATQTQRPVQQPRPAAQPQRPAQQPRPAAQPQRPAQQPRPAAKPQEPVASVNGARPISAKVASKVQDTRETLNYTRRRQAPSDEEIFKKNLSESESRAMMFALTGRAEEPEHGGEVDIINMGRISSPKKKKSNENSASYIGKYIGRFFAVVGALLLFVVVAVFATVGTIAHGPSETIRDLLVQSAMQASATKWVPYLFLPAETVDSIITKSEEVVEDKVSLEDYNSDKDTSITEDEWANAKDGMIFETVSGSTFKAYVLLVKDPSRIFCGTSTDNFANAKAGVNVFQAAARYNAIACINAGEFADNGGHGSGYAPMGLTYSEGKCVYDDKTVKTFIGFDKENKLIVRESMTQAEANSLGIRDAVSFQNGNTLIYQDGDNIVLSYEDGNAGTSQRTAIGQRADGVVIMIVTDGRSASSLGATHNDMIDLMVSYGATTAGMLDGGSSAMMYYENYFDKYGYDTSKLDDYQKKGLVNNYKAFTEPRRIPTFFMVIPEGEE